MRNLILFLLILILAPQGAAAAPALAPDAVIQAKIVVLRATLSSEAEALEAVQESEWWNLVNRRRRETRLRRLRALKLRIDRLEKELAELKKP